MNNVTHLFEDPQCWNDIPKDFKLVNYFRFCRLQKNYLIEHPHIFKKILFFRLPAVIVL